MWFSYISHITCHCHFVTATCILSLWHSHRYRPTTTLDQWLHVSLRYTTQDTIISCSWPLFHGYATLICHVLGSPSHRHANAQNVLDTVISWGPLCMLHSYIDTENHYIITAYSWTTDTQVCYYTATWLGYIQLLHVLIPLDPSAYMHWLSTYSCLHGSWFILVLHGYSWIPVILNTVSVTCIIVTRVVHPVFSLHDYFLLLILIFPLLDMRAVDMRYVKSHIYCSRSRYIVPVSRYIVLCYQQSSGPVIMLPVSCTVFILVTLYTWYIRS